jgi:hypothetical protein
LTFFERRNYAFQLLVMMGIVARAVAHGSAKCESRTSRRCYLMMASQSCDRARPHELRRRNSQS